MSVLILLSLISFFKKEIKLILGTILAINGTAIRGQPLLQMTQLRCMVILDLFILTKKVK